jgi:hypothetical protein
MIGRRIAEELKQRGQVASAQAARPARTSQTLIDAALVRGHDALKP